MKKNLTIFAFWGLLFSNHLFAGGSMGGGSITYKYISSNASTATFAVELKMLKNCPNKIYFDKTAAISVCNANNSSQYGTVTLAFDTEYTVDYQYPDMHKKPAKMPCVREGLWKGNISVPFSNYGYNLTYERCCRDTSENITPFKGVQIFAFLVCKSKLFNTSAKNPHLTSFVVPNNKRSFFSLAQMDKDDDSLSYELALPKCGNVTEKTPQGSTCTLTDASYLSGYSLTTYGSSKLKMDATGTLMIEANQKGYLTIAVQTNEYRNGTLVGTSIRDIQILVQ